MKTQEIQKASEIDATKYLTAMNLAPKLNNAEKTQFLEICNAFNLNPFKREIYATKYGDNFSIIIGYESYIKRAEMSGQLSGWNVVTEGNVKDNSLKAIVTIHRKDFNHPFIHEVYYYEYVQKTKTGQINKFWREKPVTMTKKVGIAQAFRLCFSVDVGGMPYTKEEIASEEEFAVYEEVQESKSNDDLVNKLMSIKNLKELMSIWDEINPRDRKIPEVLEAKEIMKAKLTEDDKK